jgi:hypothetical protein
MKLTLDKALSLVAAGVLGVLGTAQAASVYEIANLEDFDFKGPGKGALEGTRNGYGMSINDANQLVGISQGRKKLDATDVEGGVIDLNDGIAPQEKISYSINTAIIANNFVFTADGAWLPVFDSINGATDPSDTDTVNSVDSFYYDINAAGLRVGSMTAPETKVAYTGTTAGQEFWFIRDYELRGVVKSGDTELALLPPFTTYTKDDKTVNLGGWSAATAVNNNNLIAGYAGTDIGAFAKDRVNSCLGSTSMPVDVCVQQEQYPSANGSRNIQYQQRAYVWQYADGQVSGTELPLGLTPASDSNAIFTAQALGLNDEDVVVGRSYVYRNGDTNRLANDAAYWVKNAQGQFAYHWVPVVDVNEVRSSIAYDINDSGILVGSYKRYIDGYLRDKFFTFDTKASDAVVITPNDFTGRPSDLSAKPKDINNQGQVVGSIEVTFEKDKPRPKEGFLFEQSTGEFNNLNSLLTCKSKGYVEATDGSWSRNKVEVQDGSGKTLSYDTDIKVVEANSINEAGLIVGTAFIRKPSYQLDALGKLVVGDNDKPLFALDGNGKPVTSYLPRMVVLQPTNSGVKCDAIDVVTEVVNYERKGAAGLGWLFALPLLWFRRRLK